jgi:hypothetical protein
LPSIHLGELVLIATRRRKIAVTEPFVDPRVEASYTKEQYTLLPSYLTWAKLHEEYKLYAGCAYEPTSVE